MVLAEVETVSDWPRGLECVLEWRENVENDVGDLKAEDHNQ